MNGLPLRRFGLVFCALFALLAYSLRENPWAPWILAALSAGTLAAALARPSLLTGPTRAWMKLGNALHRIVSPIVLGALYGLLIVPTGWLRRGLGGDPLKRRYDPAAASYWTPCEPRSRSLDDFREPF